MGTRGFPLGVTGGQCVMKKKSPPFLPFPAATRCPHQHTRNNTHANRCRPGTSTHSGRLRSSPRSSRPRGPKRCAAFWRGLGCFVVFLSAKHARGWAAAGRRACSLPSPPRSAAPHAERIRNFSPHPPPQNNPIARSDARARWPSPRRRRWTTGSGKPPRSCARSKTTWPSTWPTRCAPASGRPCTRSRRSRGGAAGMATAPMHTRWCSGPMVGLRRALRRRGPGRIPPVPPAPGSPRAGAGARIRATDPATTGRSPGVRTPAHSRRRPAAGRGACRGQARRSLPSVSRLPGLTRVGGHGRLAVLVLRGEGDPRPSCLRSQGTCVCFRETGRPGVASAPASYSTQTPTTIPLPPSSPPIIPLPPPNTHTHTVVELAPAALEKKKSKGALHKLAKMLRGGGSRKKGGKLGAGAADDTLARSPSVGQPGLHRRVTRGGCSSGGVGMQGHGPPGSCRVSLCARHCRATWTGLPAALCVRPARKQALLRPLTGLPIQTPTPTLPPRNPAQAVQRSVGRFPGSPGRQVAAAGAAAGGA